MGFVIRNFSEQYKIKETEAAEAVIDFVSVLEDRRQLVWRATKVQKVDVPPHNYLILEVTNKCNLSCIHCSVEANERKGEELTGKEWKNLIDSIAIMGVEAVGLSGGEPLLRGDIFELAEYAINKGLLVGLPTNGLLLNEENIHDYKETGY